jgi:acyl-CoA thioesterase-2
LVEATLVEAGMNGLEARLDPAWDIWGPAGGYVAGIALSAVRTHAQLGQRPITLTGQFVSVARPGRLHVQVETVKAGSTALYSVALSQAERTIFLAQVWTSSRDNPSLSLMPAMPSVPPPSSLRGQDELMAERGVDQIAFWRNLEGRPANFRLAADPPAAEPHQHRWMRFRDWAPTADPFVEAMRHLLLIDIGIWPAHWHRHSAQGGYLAPSLDVWAHFHGGPPAGEWLLSDADADVSGHGTISGRVRLWSEDGRAVATGGGHCLVTIPRAKSA